jgi:AcrR family transcriptional regulator
MAALPMPRPSQREAILHAAAECFAEQGFDATRVRHVATRAGVSDAALYRHFPSMRALGQELFTQVFAEYAQRLQHSTSDGPTEARLRSAVRTTLALWREQPAASTFALLRTSSFLPDAPRGTVYPLEVIERLIAAGQRRREVRPGQPNLLAAIFLGCVLRPIELATLAAPGALDLLDNERHDHVIEEAAVAALRPPGGPS